MTNRYPRIASLNITVKEGSVDPLEVDRAVIAAFGEDGPDLFSNLFGVQTCPEVDGKLMLYAWDVEAVLERMYSGRLTGSQLLWD